MTSSTKADWLVPAALIALSAVPVAAGAVRLVGLAGGADITPDNARFFAAPVPIVLHILSVSLYCVLGAFQFAPGFRRRRPGWHRAAGRLLVPCGLVAALSGLGRVETADVFPIGSPSRRYLGNEKRRASLGSDRRRAGRYWGLGCASEVKLPV